MLCAAPEPQVSQLYYVAPFVATGFLFSVLLHVQFFFFFFFFFSFFFVSSLFLFLFLFMSYIFDLRKTFEGRVFDQQDTKQH